MTIVRHIGAALLLVCAAACNYAGVRPGPVVPIAPPTMDDKLTTFSDQRMAVFAGGCFWGIQAVFQHVSGVISATSGYSGGDEATANYELVSTGNTGHAESVQVIYDASKITYGTLLRVFFSVAHDPTLVNHQGPDDGTQYRSVIFTSNPEQEQIARAYVAELDQSSMYGAPIATVVTPLTGFYAAEAYHQNYATNHPNDAYIRINDAPKVVALETQFGDIYKR